MHSYLELTLRYQVFSGGWNIKDKVPRIRGLVRFLWENRKFSKKERLFKRIHDIFRIEVVIFRCATIDRKPVLLEFFGVDAIHR